MKSLLAVRMAQQGRQLGLELSFFYIGAYRNKNIVQSKVKLQLIEIFIMMIYIQMCKLVQVFVLRKLNDIDDYYLNIMQDKIINLVTNLLLYKSFTVPVTPRQQPDITSAANH